MAITYKDEYVYPQPGPQTVFMQTPADIAFYGGAAGGGKSYALLLECRRHVDVPGFGAVIFRRNTTEILSEGGLWDESFNVFRGQDARPRENRLDWTWSDTDARVSFRHLEYEHTVHKYQGSQIAMIGFDEITEFTWKMVSYMFSRNRSGCGVRPYIRGTCNPDPDSFVADMIRWYLDEAGYPIKKRSGVIRWFINLNDELHWADKPEQLINRFVHDEKMPPEAILPKSFTFIPSKITDNKILLAKDPGYMANLNALPYVERMRLLGGNWKIRPAAGNFFRREWFEVVEPLDVPFTREKARYWDRASSKPSVEYPDPSWTVGLNGSKCYATGTMFIENMIRFRNTPGVVQTAIRNAATHDGTETTVILEQDPGQAGVVELSLYTKLLAGFIFRYVKPTVDKETRAKTASAQAEHGMIKVVRGPWNDAFFNELDNFPDGAHDDIVDTLSGLVNCFEDVATINYEALSNM